MVGLFLPNWSWPNSNNSPASSVSPFAPAAMDPGSPMKCGALCPFCSRRHEDFIFLWWSAQSRLLSVYSWFIWFFETVDFQGLIISSRFKVLDCMWDLKMFSPSMWLVLQPLSQFPVSRCAKTFEQKATEGFRKGPILVHNSTAAEKSNHQELKTA